ncbi:hypothetical protein C8J56DRAFT_63261 [Mycena floridula]|nr:hypothetical protein C8J56DRAFT_63261 [Mycena floridula]
MKFSTILEKKPTARQPVMINDKIASSTRGPNAYDFNTLEQLERIAFWPELPEILVRRMHENHIVADVITHTFSKTNQNKSHLANIDPEFSTGPCGLQHHSQVDTILHLRRLFVEPAAVVMKAVIEYRDTDISERRALLQRWTLQDIMSLAQPVVSSCSAKRGDLCRIYRQLCGRRIWRSGKEKHATPSTPGHFVTSSVGSNNHQIPEIPTTAPAASSH